MTHRKGEITRADLKRKWPHHVALSADKVQGHENCAALAPQRCSQQGPRFTYHLDTSQGLGPTESAKALGIGRASAYRVSISHPPPTCGRTVRHI